MAKLLLAVLLASAASTAVASSGVHPPRPVERPAFDRAEHVDCPAPVLQHTDRRESTGPSRLGDLPHAWRLHAVNRTVAGCAVAPEATRISDRTGRPAEPRPAPR